MMLAKMKDTGTISYDPSYDFLFWTKISIYAKRQGSKPKIPSPLQTPEWRLAIQRSIGASSLIIVI